MSGNRRRLRLNTVAVSIGCGCRRPKLSDIFRPRPKKSIPKPHSEKHNLGSYDCYGNSGAGAAYSSLSPNTDPDGALSAGGFGWVGGETVAVEKESEDPYLDFRGSMLQMILENEIYSKEDLRELLNCFLQLNSPDNHGIIVRAFTEIWNGVFTVRTARPSSRVSKRRSREFYGSHVQ